MTKGDFIHKAAIALCGNTNFPPIPDEYEYALECVAKWADLIEAIAPFERYSINKKALK